MFKLNIGDANEGLGRGRGLPDGRVAHDKKFASLSRLQSPETESLVALRRERNPRGGTCETGNAPKKRERGKPRGAAPQGFSREIRVWYALITVFVDIQVRRGLKCICRRRLADGKQRIQFPYSPVGRHSTLDSHQYYIRRIHSRARHPIRQYRKLI